MILPTLDTERECVHCGEWITVKENDESVTCPECLTIYSVDHDIDGVSLYKKGGE